jgi:hypothetical protein
VNVWSPKNPKGHQAGDVDARGSESRIAQRKEIADLPGISILACGIGSLTQALGGDRAGAERARSRCSSKPSA